MKLAEIYLRFSLFWTVFLDQIHSNPIIDCC